MKTVEQLMDSNRKTIQEFIALGDDSFTRRGFLHYIYYKEPKVLKEVKKHCKKFDFTIKRVEKINDCGGAFDYLMMLVSCNDATLKEINRVSLNLLITCKKLNLYYDGWETKIITK